MTRRNQIPASDEARLKSGLHRIGSALEADQTTGHITSEPYTTSPPQRRRTAALIGAAAVVVIGIGSAIAVSSGETPSGVEASEVGSASVGEAETAEAFSIALLPRVADRTGASFSTEAIATAVAERDRQQADQAEALREYFDTLDPDAAGEPLVYSDSLVIGGQTSDQKRLLVQVLIPGAPERASGEDRPAFGIGDYTDSDVGDATVWQRSQPGALDGTIVTDLEIHSSNAVVGFRIESSETLDPATVDAYIQAVVD